MTMVCAGMLLFAAACMASGGKVTYPDGKPVVGAVVYVHLQEVNKYTLATDATGRFTLPDEDFLDAFVQIKAPDGKEFATVNLPVEVFQAGDVAVVLQPVQ
ncbi:carboxypeptidase-like regulatory domain-containing protein [Geomonas subterranea]|nr:carboxypeptidase-like regulatory domain-containing protein [Geomonas subterranea]QXM09168.1 carboxypeptidase-like regulatory domain-containing protein [Geomonas subterranea]